MKLSVIICTYNRARYIYNVLESIAAGTFSANDYEIVVVDNNCTDNTASEIGRFRTAFPEVQLKVVKETAQGLSNARNRGIMESSGDILVYVDDDAPVNKEYLSVSSDFFGANPD